MVEVKIIADSSSPFTGQRITTMQLRYWRAIHAEFMTHRCFSRNASSSRAIPVAKMLEQVRNDPAGPVHWGKNQPGMQANEQLDSPDMQAAKNDWLAAARSAAAYAESMSKTGLHKQVANRVLEPFQYISVVVTATDWDNFFALRCHPAAQPEIQELAVAMRKALSESTPLVRYWHLPYITQDEIAKTDCGCDYRSGFDFTALCKLSTARCARVSYLKHDGAPANHEEDIALHDRLVGSHPMHASPAEHQAFARSANDRCRNFRGWTQYREILENGITG